MQRIPRLVGPRRIPRIDPIGFLMRRDARYREERAMRELADWQLQDIGVTRAEIDSLLDRR